MSTVAYTVTAVLPSEAVAREYIAWLEDGHVDSVVSAGAHSATIVRQVEPREADGKVRVEVRYIFSTRAMYETYIEYYAPALRAEGLRRFGPTSGKNVVFERRVGEVV